MRIAIVGGTGDLGRGLALHWSKTHDVVIGSREEKRALDTSQELSKKARDHYGDSMDGSIKGLENSQAVKGAGIIILTIPHSTISSTIVSIRDSVKPGQLLVSPVVPMEKVGPTFKYKPYQASSNESKSAAETLANMLPQGVDIASAFHTVPAGRLQNVGEVLDADVVISSDTRQVFDRVVQLVTAIPNLRPLYGGRLDMASQIESITPLLLNLHANSRATGKAMNEPTIKFV
jgi:NADPH-dependent F420 reductase